MSAAAPRSEADREAVRDAARTHNLDGYLASLLAPFASRDDLITLSAYLGELRRIPLGVREAALAQIRLQWWRDAIMSAGGGLHTGNPVADALSELVSRRGLSVDRVLAPLEACEALLSGKIESEAGFAAFLCRAGAAPLHLSGEVLGVAADEPTRAFLDAAGRSLASMQLALDLPGLWAMERRPVPMSFFGFDQDFQSSEENARRKLGDVAMRLMSESRVYRDRARALQPEVARPAVVAALPVALFGPYIRAFERADRGRLGGVVTVLPLTRIAVLWLAHRRGRV